MSNSPKYSPSNKNINPKARNIAVLNCDFIEFPDSFD
jgi:hypothetical protein